jgi:hypothetical protein
MSRKYKKRGVKGDFTEYSSQTSQRCQDEDNVITESWEGWQLKRGEN